jgi:hypothetical protein
MVAHTSTFAAFLVRAYVFCARCRRVVKSAPTRIDSSDEANQGIDQSVGPVVGNTMFVGLFV